MVFFGCRVWYNLFMEEKSQKELDLDVIKHLENLSSQLNRALGHRTQSVLRRYPVLFGLLILLGATSLHEGLKGVLEDMGLLGSNPMYLIVGGNFVLIITGTLYKKLEK